MHLNEKEIVELSSLLERAYSFVKGGPSPDLENSLKDYLVNFKSKISSENENYLTCPICNFEYSHLIATLTVKDNDEYETLKIIVNDEFSLPLKTKYSFRSQGNIHMLFACEDGHIFIESFDGHKGIVYVNDNPLMDELAAFLNDSYKNKDEVLLDFNYELLGNIEKFFNEKDDNFKAPNGIGF